jgi:hypothetical protein
MTASVDFPVPRMPIRTIEASGLNLRCTILCNATGAGVSRGVVWALVVAEAVIVSTWKWRRHFGVNYVFPQH